MKNSDSRRSPRQWVEADVEVVDIESRIHGCGIRTSEPFAPRTSVTVTFTRGQEKIRASGRIVYGTPELGMGVAFTTIEPEDQRILERWLTELAGQ